MTFALFATTLMLVTAVCFFLFDVLLEKLDSRLGGTTGSENAASVLGARVVPNGTDQAPINL